MLLSSVAHNIEDNNARQVSGDDKMAYALITGGSGGIGLELARIFAANGHNLILTARNENKLQGIKTELQETYPIEVQIISRDLSVKDSAGDLHTETVKKGFRVDYLVNNAGFGDHASFLASNWDRQNEMVQLNITALMQMTYLYGNDMKQNGFGRILNLASVAAFSPGPYMSNYYASKAYVLSFSQAVNMELKGTGVTVTALCPGPVATDFEKNAHMRNSRMFTKLGVASAANVAACGFRAMNKGKPCVYHGTAVKLMNIGSRLSTRNLTARFAAWVNGKPKDETANLK